MTKKLNKNLKKELLDVKAKYAKLSEKLEILERKSNSQEGRSKVSFRCDKCDKKYIWYSGLANHKRFLHNKQNVK